MDSNANYKITDAYGKEYNVTFIYGNLPSSTVAKELASLCNLSTEKSEATNREGVILVQQI